MKFCKDCQHIRDAHRTSFEKCAALVERNVVTGELKPIYCTTARTSGYSCGPDGNLFVPIQVVENAPA